MPSRYPTPLGDSIDHRSARTEAAAIMPTVNPIGIEAITVRDFKSLAGKHSIEVRPLTILAGANSSGKSSIMQPLLLMKQTLEATYDPGALLLDGPILKFTSSDQLFTAGTPGRTRKFSAGLRLIGAGSAESGFSKKDKDRAITVERTTYRTEAGEFEFSEGMSPQELARVLDVHDLQHFTLDKVDFRLDKFFWRIHYPIVMSGSGALHVYVHMKYPVFPNPKIQTSKFFNQIRCLIRVPGLRGNPLRAYPLAATGKDLDSDAPGPQFEGSFENYTASLIHHWQTSGRSDLIGALATDLYALSLTTGVDARLIDETRVELRVDRLNRPGGRGKSDLVNVADVGFGVSQALPVLVALHAARPGQLVYLEQPEIHLHPRAQQAMATVLARAAMRGVRVVAETHSDLLILGIRTMIAEGRLPAELVKLHWFQRNDKGLTTITSADLDERGASAGWPEDFADVQLDAQARYLDAAELRSEAR